MEDEKKCRGGCMYESNLLLGVALHYLFVAGSSKPLCAHVGEILILSGTNLRSQFAPLQLL